MIVRLYGVAFCMSILFFDTDCFREYSRFMSAAGWKAACSGSPYLCVHDSVLCISNQFGNGILQQCGADYKRRRPFFKEGIRTDA